MIEFLIGVDFRKSSIAGRKSIKFLPLRKISERKSLFVAECSEWLGEYIGNLNKELLSPQNSNSH